MEQTNTSSQHTTMPPNTAQQPFPQTTPTIPSKNKKRKLSTVDIHNSSYFKIRTIVQELRPHFIEVLRTPDFQNCKAAHEIRKHMKLVMDLYKQMQIERNPVRKLEDMSECQPLSGERRPGKETLDGHKEGIQEEHLQPIRFPEKSVEKKPQSVPFSSEKKLGDGRVQGTYVVGGSVFGWNFITFAGSKPIYYGVTKESHRTSHSKAENGNVAIRTDISKNGKPPVVM